MPTPNASGAGQFRLKRRKNPAMKVTRRQFLTFSSGVIGTAALAEAAVLGEDTAAVKEKALKVPIKTGRQVPSLCPYCSVGCAQIVTVDDKGKIIDIQGNPDSPINQGTLCPKGAATWQFVNNDQRWTTVKYRAPGSDHWEDKRLDWAMQRIAELTKQTRDAHFNEYQNMPDGKGGMVQKRVMNTYSVASLGGATMDNEWNYAHQKLMHALGVVYLENQARI
jgi:formate dehydrogenase major subunit